MPEALMHVTTVTRAPLSADDKRATCFLPFIANALLALCCSLLTRICRHRTTYWGRSPLFLFQIIINRWKRQFRRENFTLANSVAWDVHRANSGCIFKKFSRHFFPAHSTVSEKVWRILFLMATGNAMCLVFFVVKPKKLLSVFKQNFRSSCSNSEGTTYFLPRFPRTTCSTSCLLFLK
jgi:hypothetical protein